MHASTESDVLWDVMQEHLWEAEFLLGQTLRVFDSWKHTLGSLSEGFEQRLIAQVDALAVGGDAVLAELSQAMLRMGSPTHEKLVTLYLVMICMGRQARVISELSSDELRRHAAEQALALFAGSELEAWLVETVPRVRDERALAPLLRIAARRGLSMPGVEAWLRSDDREIAAGAAQLVASAGVGAPITALEELLDHTHASVREAAMGSLLVLGSARAKSVCRAWATRSKEPSTAAILGLALSADDRDYATLMGLVGVERTAEAAVHALGYAGKLSCVPLLLELASGGSDACRRLAGEAFSNLTGLSLAAPEYTIAERPPANTLPSLADDDLDANLVPSAVQSLPLPNPEALAAWWRKHEAAIPSEARVLGGKRWDVAASLDWLRTAPLRRRHPVGTWLTVQSVGRARLDTRALTPVQYRQLDACARSAS